MTEPRSGAETERAQFPQDLVTCEWWITAARSREDLLGSGHGKGATRPCLRADRVRADRVRGAVRGLAEPAFGRET